MKAFVITKLPTLEGECHLILARYASGFQFYIEGKFGDFRSSLMIDLPLKTFDMKEYIKNPEFEYSNQWYFKNGELYLKFDDNSNLKSLWLPPCKFKIAKGEFYGYKFGYSAAPNTIILDNSVFTTEMMFRLPLLRDFIVKRNHKPETIYTKVVRVMRRRKDYNFIVKNYAFVVEDDKTLWLLTYKKVLEDVISNETIVIKFRKTKSGIFSKKYILVEKGGKFILFDTFEIVDKSVIDEIDF